MSVKQEKSAVWLLLKIPLPVLNLFIAIMVDRFILKNSSVTLFTCFTFILKRGVVLPKTGVFRVRLTKGR